MIRIIGEIAGWPLIPTMLLLRIEEEVGEKALFKGYLQE